MQVDVPKIEAYEIGRDSRQLGVYANKSDHSGIESYYEFHKNAEMLSKVRFNKNWIASDFAMAKDLLIAQNDVPLFVFGLQLDRTEVQYKLVVSDAIGARKDKPAYKDALNTIITRVNEWIVDLKDESGRSYETDPEDGAGIDVILSNRNRSDFKKAIEEIGFTKIPKEDIWSDPTKNVFLYGIK